MSLDKFGNSLQHLDISWSSLGDQAAKVIADTCGANMQVLDLSGTTITEAGIKTLLLECHNLRSLSLTSCRSAPRDLKRVYSSVNDIATLRSTLIPKGKKKR